MNFELDKNLSESWEIATIGEITLPYETEQPAKKPETEFKYIDISSIDNSTQTITNIKTFLGKDAPSRARRIVRKDDILFSTVRTYLKNIARVPDELDGVLTSTGIAVLRCTSGIDSNFLFYCVLSDKFIRKISSTMDGTLYPAVTDTDVMSAAIVIPPLNEQRRIVAKIEALKARSQRVKEALEDIPQLLNQFRQSVLAAAFRGDLTADWREQNPNVVEWEITTLQEVIKGKPRNGYSPKSVDYPTKVKSITLTATTSGIFKPEYFKYIDEEISIDSYLWLSPGDILIQRSNTIEYVGTCAVYNGGFGEFIYPDLMMKIQVIEEKATPEFIFYALSNKATRLYFRKNATGTAGNMPKINQPIVMNTPVSLPSIEEQKEIVYQIKSLYKSVDIIKQQYQEIKANLDRLDQSILAKAFRGELVPQDPNDEPASVLLERIHTEREKLDTKRKAKGKSEKKSRKAKPEAAPEQLSFPGFE